MNFLLGIIGIILGVILITQARKVIGLLTKIGAGTSLSSDEMERLTMPRIIGVVLIVVSFLIMFGSPQVIAGLTGLAIGVLLVTKSKSIMDFFGTVSWAEQHLGSGGTDKLWKLVGVIIIIFSFLWIAGDTQKMFWNIMGQFFGKE